MRRGAGLALDPEPRPVHIGVNRPLDEISQEARDHMANVTVYTNIG
jgi:hypothetical protein